MEKIFGLIGYPLSHSFSSGYFSKKFLTENITGCRYENFQLSSIELFPHLLKQHPNLAGLNVTIPYKEAVIPYLDQLSDAALEIGAVNTISITREGSKIITRGYNTDVVGFERSLEKNSIKKPSRALILGTGGAAKAVEWVLKQYNCQVLFASRKPGSKVEVSYSDIDAGGMKEFDLVVNATPLGMYPKIDECPPLPYHAALPTTTFFDLIYNPPVTLFLQKAAAQHCKTINGLYMLEQQAEKAWEIWNTPHKV